MILDVDGRPRHLNGWRRKLIHPDNRLPRMSLPSGWVGPSEVDLISKMRSIKDQGAAGACAGFSTARALSPWIKDASGLYLYDGGRILEGTPLDQDTGTAIADVFRFAEKYGVCSEKTCSDDPTTIDFRLMLQPSQEADAEAASRRVQISFECRSLQEIQATIAQGFPCVIGIAVPSSMMDEQCARDGIVHFPKSTEKIVGQHAICIEGYKTMKVNGTTGLWLRYANSWGAGWGEHGRGWLDARFVTEGMSDDYHTPRYMVIS